MTTTPVHGNHPLPGVPWFLRSKRHLLLTLALVLGLPLAVFAVGIAWNARRALHAQAVQENMTAARLAAQVVESHFEGLKRCTELAARSPALAAAAAAKDAATGEVELQRLLSENPALDRAFVTDPEGVEWFDWPHDQNVVGKSFAYRDWYQSVSKLGGTYVSEFYRRAALDQAPIVAIATPIRGDGGACAGYLVAQHRVQTLADRLISIEPGPGGKLTLIDHREHLISKVDRSNPNVPTLESHPVAQTMLAESRDSIDAADPETQDPSVFSLAHVESLHWVVLAQQSLALVLAPAARLQQWIALLSVLCFASVLLLGFAWLNVFRRQHLALIALQRQKDLLSGMIVHDLRNPIGVAMISLESAQLGLQARDSAVREDLENAHAAARRTLELVNVILDVMRMEDGALRLERSEDDLVGIVREKVEEHRPLARAGAIELEARVPSNPAPLAVDKRLLRRVVDNLIVNAIKHTPRGGRIEVKLESDPSSDRARLSVVDDGEGMPAEMLPRLFQKYGRVDGQKMGQSHDTGLGLLFCRMAIELHGGTISARSALGEGTSICIDLPRR